jgi:hypothetical protein
VTLGRGGMSGSEKLKPPNMSISVMFTDGSCKGQNTAEGDRRNKSKWSTKCNHRCYCLRGAYV